jgi:hypothetical protein
MSAPLNVERFLGGFAWFIESGLTVDAQTITPLIKPDVTPLTNWTDRSLGDILSLKLENKNEDRSYKRPSTTGGWEIVPRTVVMQDSLALKSRQMGEQLLRLQFGLVGTIAEGTAQTPFANTDRRIEGWLRLQSREESGLDLMILDSWVSMELTGGIVADGKVSEPEFRLTVIKSYAGAAIAGNSIVFPVKV